MNRRPSVLVLMCDQMQHDRMGWRDGVAHTPVLDRLAKEGVRFTNAYTCQGQCAPARAAFITGLYAHQCGVMVNCGSSFHGHAATLGPQHVTLGHVFRDCGYRTAYFGKTHFGVPLTKLGFDVGLDITEVSMPEEKTMRQHAPYASELMWKDAVATEEAVRYLRDYKPDDRPLFFVFSINLPHPPFFAEPRYIDLFRPERMEVPRSYHEERFAGKPRYQKEHAEDGKHGAGDESAVRTMISRYYSMIALMDDYFGQVVAEFERLGLWDNTVVLFTADHGDMLGAHGMRLKGTLPYDELYRIPCLLKLPKQVQPARQQIPDLISSERFAGTLLRAAGLDLPASFVNGDMYAAILASEPPGDQAVFFEHYAAYWGIHPFYGIRTPAHKYVRYYGPDDTEELYAMEADPHELRNLAKDPAFTAVRQALSDRAAQWWHDTGGRDFAYYESPDFKAGKHNQWAGDLAAATNQRAALC